MTTSSFQLQHNPRLYSILGLPQGASSSQVRKAYRDLALKYHPDKSESNSERFKEVNAAYHLLRDEEKKRQYDAQFVFMDSAAQAGSDFNAASVHKRNGFNFQRFQRADASMVDAELRSLRAQNGFEKKGNSRDMSSCASSKYSEDQLAEFKRRDREREKQLKVTLQRLRKESELKDVKRSRVTQDTRLERDERRRRLVSEMLLRVPQKNGKSASTVSSRGSSTCSVRSEPVYTLRRRATSTVNVVTPPSVSSLNPADSCLGGKPLSTGSFRAAEHQFAQTWVSQFTLPSGRDGTAEHISTLRPSSCSRIPTKNTSTAFAGMHTQSPLTAQQPATYMRNISARSASSTKSISSNLRTPRASNLGNSYRDTVPRSPSLSTQLIPSKKSSLISLMSMFPSGAWTWCASLREEEIKCRNSFIAQEAQCRCIIKLEFDECVARKKMLVEEIESRVFRRANERKLRITLIGGLLDNLKKLEVTLRIFLVNEEECNWRRIEVNKEESICRVLIATDEQLFRCEIEHCFRESHESSSYTNGRTSNFDVEDLSGENIKYQNKIKSVDGSRDPYRILNETSNRGLVLLSTASSKQEIVEGINATLLQENKELKEKLQIASFQYQADVGALRRELRECKKEIQLLRIKVKL